jgi:hypothetical protein
MMRIFFIYMAGLFKAPSNRILHEAR